MLFYSLLFCLLGVIILALVVARRRVEVKEEARDSSQFTYDDALKDSKSIFAVKSPYLQDTKERVGSFIRTSSFGYSDMTGQTDSMFTDDSPIVTAQKEEEAALAKPSNFSYDDMTGKDSMFEMTSPIEKQKQLEKEEDIAALAKPSNFSYDDVTGKDSLFQQQSPYEVAKEENIAALAKPSNFSYNDAVRQDSLLFSTENTLHVEAKTEEQNLVVTDESDFGISNNEMTI
jgi:hypothetical protein